jgi:hypothetical protein
MSKAVERLAPVQPGTTPGHDQRAVEDETLCDICGMHALVWRKCKLICDNCRTIIKSCADS